MILADKDMTNGWGGAADGTREKRVYLLQNWRADVSCVTDQAGKVLEWIKYSPYGVPFRIDPADFDRDGDVDSADSSAFTTEYNNGTPRADANHDGFIDFTDFDLYTDNYNAASAGGRNVLSRGGSASGGIHNRIGYAGYLWDSATSQYHVRNRVFLPSSGTWNRRDPIGYVDGLSVYEYVQNMPVNAVDPQGLKLCVWCGDRCCTLDPDSKDPVNDGDTTPPDASVVGQEEGRKPGASRRAAKCTSYCDNSYANRNVNDGFAHGTTLCDGDTKSAFTCICDTNIGVQEIPLPGGSKGYLDPSVVTKYEECVKQHEAVHVSDYDCSNTPAGEFDKKYKPGKNNDCSERDAYSVSLGCIQQISCPSGPAGTDCRQSVAFIQDMHSKQYQYFNKRCRASIPVALPPNSWTPAGPKREN